MKKPMKKGKGRTQIKKTIGKETEGYTPKGARGPIGSTTKSMAKRREKRLENVPM